MHHTILIIRPSYWPHWGVLITSFNRWVLADSSCFTNGVGFPLDNHVVFIRLPRSSLFVISVVLGWSLLFSGLCNILFLDKLLLLVLRRILLLSMLWTRAFRLLVDKITLVGDHIPWVSSTCVCSIHLGWETTHCHTLEIVPTNTIHLYVMVVLIGILGLL